MEISSLFATIGLEVDQQALIDFRQSLIETAGEIEKVFNEAREIVIIDNTKDFRQSLIETAGEIEKVFNEAREIVIIDNTKEIKDNINNNIQEPLKEVEKQKEKLETPSTFGLSDIFTMVSAVTSLINVYKQFTNYKNKTDQVISKGTTNSLSAINSLKKETKSSLSSATNDTMTFTEKMIAIVPVIMAGMRAVSLLSKVIKTNFIGAIKQAIVSCWSFTVALLANPITWVVAGIMALVGAITSLFVIYKKFGSWDNFKKGVDKNGNAVKGWAMTVRNIVVSIHNFFTKMFAMIIIGFENFIEFFKQGWQKIKDIFSSIKEYLMSFIQPIIDMFSNAFSWIGDKVKGLTKYLPKSIQSKLGIDANVKDNMKDNMKDNLSSNLENIKPEISNNSNLSNKQDNRQINTNININGAKEPKEIAKEISNYQEEINSTSYILDGVN